MDFIALDDCEDRRIYQLDSRNLRFGAFSAAVKGFIGIRLKFGQTFLATEYHWDTGAPFGTACPLRALDLVVPEDIPLQEHLDLTNNDKLFDLLNSIEAK